MVGGAEMGGTRMGGEGVGLWGFLSAGSVLWCPFGLLAQSILPAGLGYPPQYIIGGGYSKEKMKQVMPKCAFSRRKLLGHGKQWPVNL